MSLKTWTWLARGGGKKKNPKPFLLCLFLYAWINSVLEEGSLPHRENISLWIWNLHFDPSQKIKVVEIKTDSNNRTESARCAGNVSPLCFFDLCCSWLLFMSRRNVDVRLASMQISWIITSGVGGQTQIKPTAYELNNDVMFRFAMDFNALLLWKEFYTQVQCVNKCTVSCFLLHLLLGSFSLEQISIPHSWTSNLTLEVSRGRVGGNLMMLGGPFSGEPRSERASKAAAALASARRQEFGSIWFWTVLKTIKANSRGTMLTATHGLISCVPNCILLLVHFSV